MFLLTRAEMPGLMEWSRLYANLPDEPRVQAAEDSDNAGWLLVQSIGYCTRVERGGFIPHTQVPRFGGPRLKQRVAALVREKIWIEVEGGYELDPEIWSEERNLSDQAERKRKADRERVAAKRAAARAGQNGSQMSRDSRATESATSRATNLGITSGADPELGPNNVNPGVNPDGYLPVLCNPQTAVQDADLRSVDNPPEMSRDSRTHRRGEKRRPSPLPPTVSTPLWPAAVANATPEEEGEKPDQHEQTDPGDVDALIADVLAIRPAWSARSLRRILTDPDIARRPWPAVRAAALAVARDPDSKQPGRLAHDGPWWESPPTATPPRPTWCGACDEQTRLTRGDAPRRCPACHPLTTEKAS
jgi:hypothetical protein